MNENSIKILYIFAFISILCALIVIICTPAANSYEISIYSAFPWFFWVFLIFPICIGLASVVQFANSQNKSHLWIIGILMILLSNFIVLTLQLSRGYALYGNGDTLSHIGYIKDIFYNGHISIQSYYPVFHVLISMLSSISSISYMNLILCFPAVFSVVYTILIYILAKKLFNKKFTVMIAVALGSILLLMGYHTYFSVNALTLFIFPLILYLIVSNFKERKASYSLLITIFFIWLVFAHMLVATFMLIILISIPIWKYLYNAKINNKEDSKVPTKEAILLLLISIIVWFSYTSIWGSTIRNIFNWMQGEIAYTPMADLSNVVVKLNFYEIISLIIKLYGGYILIGIVCVIGLFFVLKKIKKVSWDEFFVFGLLFFIFPLLILLFFAPASGVDFLRPLRFLSVPLCLFGALSIYYISNIKKLKPITKNSIIILVLIIPAVIGIFNVHTSPFIMQPNQQVTAAEISGMEFYFNEKDPNIKTMGINSRYRFSFLIYGYSEGDQRLKKYLDFPELINTYYVGDHFENISTIKYPRYVVFSKSDQLLYTQVWKTNRFTNEDFKNIENESYLDYVYSNGDLKVFYYLPTK